MPCALWRGHSAQSTGPYYLLLTTFGAIKVLQLDVPSAEPGAAWSSCVSDARPCSAPAGGESELTGCLDAPTLVCDCLKRLPAPLLAPITLLELPVGSPALLRTARATPSGCLHGRCLPMCWESFLLWRLFGFSACRGELPGVHLAETAFIFICEQALTTPFGSKPAPYGVVRRSR